jgi:hypothetical protein
VIAILRDGSEVELDPKLGATAAEILTRAQEALEKGEPGGGA